MKKSLAVVFALREEIKPILKEAIVQERFVKKPYMVEKAVFRGVPVVFCQTGIGLANAHEGTEFLLEHFSPSLIISVGFGGGTLPHLKTGQLVVASEIRSETPTDLFHTDTAARSFLENVIREEKIPFQPGTLTTLWKLANAQTKKSFGEKGTAVIDMETAATAVVATHTQVPVVSLRAVFDSVNDELPFTEAYTDETNPIGFLFRNPKAILQIPKFIRMNQICQKNIAKVLGRFIETYQN